VLYTASDVTGQPYVLDVLDWGCQNFPQYVALNCSCWLIGYKACPATAPLFCRQCTKDWPKPLSTGSNRVPATLPTTWAASVLRNDKRVRAASHPATLLPPLGICFAWEGGKEA
jgi:hypothetical protein